MKNFPQIIRYAGLAPLLLGLFLLGCSDQSEDIPTSFDSITLLMNQGWDAYAAGDFNTAETHFREANQRNAQHLPAYNGLGWTAVRLTNFTDAETQFSFITTLANPESDQDIRADAYAGLALSAAIERSVTEIGGEAGEEELNALARQSIDNADIALGIDPTYDPADHDPGFGAEGLHLLNAQNYFYLKEIENSEAALSVVDPEFVPNLLATYGTEVLDEATGLDSETAEGDTTWFLPLDNPGVHHFTSLVSADTTLDVEYLVDYEGSRILVIPGPDQGLAEGLGFTVDYVYIEAMAEYLYHLSQRIEELIEF
ncbi:MAG: hypothetical protein C4524_06210 [Candidatus Zixiibacteriota bacterium]|nr:MAG: hypothetical protein C4524_06210 [candidate division Zixibacteria bacterium]